MLKHYKFAVVFTFLMLLSIITFAQPKVPPGNPKNPRSPAIPIDGGISILAAAGVAYGARKLYVMRQKGQE